MSNERFLIATRVHKPGGRYRTRYYRDCFDGRPRFGARRYGIFLILHDAREIIAQLRRQSPAATYFMVAQDSRPPRAKNAAASAPRVPVQLDALCEA